MPRYVHNTVLLAKSEVTYGVDSVPAGNANALLVANLSVTPLNANLVDRNVIRSVLGGFEKLPGTFFVELSFEVELVGSGALGTAPAWGPLVRACAFAESISVGARVEYNPVSSAFESVSMYYYDDGVLHKALGARGTFEIKLQAGERPMLAFKFTGLQGGQSVATNAVPTLTAWKSPLAVVDPNTGDVTFGCAYAAGALSGGTTYPSKGITFNSGVATAHTPLLGGESIDITAREASASTVLEMTPAQEVAAYTAFKDVTMTSVGIVHGVTDGYKVLVFAPNVQYAAVKPEEFNGRRLTGLDLRLVPTATGNDEIKLVVL